MRIPNDSINAAKWLIQQTVGWAVKKTLDETWKQLSAPPSPQHYQLIASVGMATDRLTYLHLPNGWYYWGLQQGRCQWIWATYLPVGFVPTVNFYSDSQGKLYWL